MTRMLKYLLPVLLILASLSGCRRESVMVIGIIPLGVVYEEDIREIRSALVEAYPYPVHILPTRALPDFAHVNVKSPRYRADKLIRWMRETRPDSIDYVIGITASDISTTKREGGMVKEPRSKYEDWGIFGLGYRPGPSCIVSTFRLRQNAGGSTFRSRLRKVAVHELGHCLGLPHCPDSSCVMTDALERISTVDKAGESLCASCRAECGG